VLAFVCYYGALIGVMSGWLAKPKVRTWLGAGLAVLGTLWLIQWQRERSATHLTVLPLSGGSAVYVDAPGRKDDLLIDCGNASAAEFTVNPFLRAQGVNRLNRLVLTHGDLRRVGGTELVTKMFAARQIITSSIQFRSPTYRRIVKNLQGTPQRWRTINREDHIGPWTVLHPSAADRFPQADDAALVLRGTFHGTGVLLFSDLGRPGQNVLIERTPDLRADIVITGLPTESEPLCDALLDVIQPRAIVIADSEFPATRRASPKLRERLAGRGIPVLYTRSAGAVRLTMCARGWELHPMNGPPVSGTSSVSSNLVVPK
jgi:competence protein ComEC